MKPGSSPATCPSISASMAHNLAESFLQFIVFHLQEDTGENPLGAACLATPLQEPHMQHSSERIGYL
eukprot:gene12191-biopygen8931